jgi:hypothetical protein
VDARNVTKCKKNSKLFTFYGRELKVNVSDGTEFNGLYTEMPQVSGGTSTGTITVNGDSHVYSLVR